VEARREGSQSALSPISVSVILAEISHYYRDSLHRILTLTHDAVAYSAGVPYSGWPLDVAGFGIADGDSPATSPGVTPGPTTPTVAKEKKSNGRGQRASSTKFKGVSCYKRCVDFAIIIFFRRDPI